MTPRKIVLLCVVMLLLVSCGATFREPVGSFTLDKKVSECKKGEKYLYLGMINVNEKRRERDLFDNVMVPRVTEDLVSNMNGDFSKAVYRLMKDEFKYDLINPLDSHIKTAQDSTIMNEDLQELILTALKDTVKIIKTLSDKNGYHALVEEKIKGYCLNTFYRSTKKSIQEFCDKNNVDGIVVGLQHATVNFKYTSSYSSCSNVSWKPITYVNYVQVISREGDLRYMIGDLTSTPGLYLKNFIYNEDGLKYYTGRAITLSGFNAEMNTLESMNATIGNKGMVDKTKMVPFIMKYGSQYLLSFPEENDTLMNEEVVYWVENFIPERFEGFHDFLSQVKLDIINTDFDTTTTFEGRVSKSSYDTGILPKYKYAYITPDTLKITLKEDQSVEEFLSSIPFYFFALRSELELGKFWAFPILNR